MAQPEINVSIDRKLKVSLKESWIRNITLKALKAEGIASSVEMGLVITDNKTIQQLNRTYRGKDEPTDVLAFHMVPPTSKETELSFVSPPDGVNHLGEVVISYPQAVKQAQEQGHSVARELALLIIHGLLHLLGYDHERPEEEQLMRARETKILEELDSI